MISPVMPTYARTAHAFVKGEGAWLVDETGRRHLDFGAGIAVNCLGHAHPKLVAALTEQASQVWHTSNLYRVPNQEKLARMLSDNTFADTAFFTNSGAEAMELCIKLSRKYQSHIDHPEKTEIITFEGCFHGRTIATISAAGAPKLTDGFGPLLPGFIQVPFGDVDALRAAITDKTAAIFVEPVQGEGGIVPAPAGFLTAIRALCDEAGALMVLDEIQCGVGRTGKLFAHEWSGVTPDVMGIAKGIGGGFPIGACLATERAAAGMVAGTHGSTYGGNPLGASVACAVLDEVLSDGFLDNVRRTASALNQKLGALIDAHPDTLESARGEGLMMGIKCKAANMDIVNACYAEDLLTVPAGDNVVRILPPLNVTPEEIDLAISKIDAACTAIETA
ncbi:MAG: aspartate aminotransferase family protein [Paracoccaceae bacterium]|nr:aspartate aminotransferase family protein [Paracoccaceae bacterium]MDG1371142.1 aspartate aminotransferase family protein [Paracoccaceae bacterium]